MMKMDQSPWLNHDSICTNQDTPKTKRKRDKKMGVPREGERRKVR